MLKITRTLSTPILSLLLILGQTACDSPRTSEGSDEHAHDEEQAHDHAAGEEHDHAAGEEHDHNVPADERRVRVAVAELEPTEGFEAQGTVTFTQVEEGIFVVVDVEGLSGPGERGFHIHEHGDCSAPDGTSAGGHFNPEGASHGAPDGEERHVGDLGNLSVDEDGAAMTEFLDTHLSFEGSTSIIGRGVIIHAGEDDLESQPTGDAGGRVACGVIRAVEYYE